MRIDDPDVPETLIACGRWVGMAVGGRTLQCDDPGAYLAFDPESPRGRLYLVLPPSIRSAMRQFWRPGARSISLESLAASVGGRHRGGYPDVEVQPVGPIHTVDYYAHKYDGEGKDAPCTYTHDHSFVLPWLAVSSDGRAWYAGGSYDATDLRGITG
ncbi:MAG: hypothetical protein Q8P18_33210 [Pseudomonadota bacterium]|nr:hypothetical protein [Pseudomonadota bacterium]